MIGNTIYIWLFTLRVSLFTCNNQSISAAGLSISLQFVFSFFLLDAFCCNCWRCSRAFKTISRGTISVLEKIFVIIIFVLSQLNNISFVRSFIVFGIRSISLSWPFNPDIKCAPKILSQFGIIRLTNWGPNTPHVHQISIS